MDKKIDPLAIVVKGYYRTRNFGIVGPLRYSGKNTFPFEFDCRGSVYNVTGNGRISVNGHDHPLDLMEQVEEPVIEPAEPVKLLVDDTPAFPRSYAADGHNGMTLRQYYAGQFLAAIIAKTPYQKLLTSDAEELLELRTRGAVLYADALIAAEKESR